MAGSTTGKRAQSRNQARLARERNKLVESAAGAIAIGVMLLLMPVLISNPIIKSIGAGLRMPGILAIGAGLAMFALSRFMVRAARTTSAQDPNAFKRPGTASEPKLRHRRVGATAVVTPTEVSREPSGGPLVDDAVESAIGASQTPATPATWGPEVFDVIEWRRFEAVCERLFVQAGFEAKTQSHGADGGIDIWLYSSNFPDGPVSVVQCKHWKSTPVKVGEVRELLGSMAHKKVGRGIFATTSTFTADARQFANENKIQLLDRHGLLGLIAKRTLGQQQELLAVATQGEYWVPTCASCGVKMTRRQRKKDGGAFWGCVNYPRCKTVINQ